MALRQAPLACFNGHCDCVWDHCCWMYLLMLLMTWLQGWVSQISASWHNHCQILNLASLVVLFIYLFLTSANLPLLIISLFWGHRFQKKSKKRKSLVFYYFFYFYFFHVVLHSPRLSWVTPSSVAYRVKVKCSLLLRRHGVCQSQLS